MDRYDYIAVLIAVLIGLAPTLLFFAAIILMDVIR